jgi:ATP-dependent Lhr-like helicase
MLTPYDRLAPFIQEYIYNQGWADLRQAQIEACQVVFETNAHLLIAAGTASGKTEAAFLPVLTLLHDVPPQTVGALYIGPIKALINDQFDRLTDLLQQADIPVWAWHGDVVQSRKHQLLKHPRGILQITPESLESLLINKNSELIRLFGELRFVIIDEVHAFIGSDRGAQILCQLSRLAKLTQNYPRRIGLSATLGDYALAEKWLQSGTRNPVITPHVESDKRTLHLSVEHFYEQWVVRAKGDRSDAAFSPYHHYLFHQSDVHKCLIFANGRMQAETAIAQLRQIAQAKGLPDRYHVHHGSISASLRESAETIMRDPHTPSVTAATVTFEMGIDLGQLDRVVQLAAPPSVSSFLQRLGRSGRRGSPADMRFICLEDKIDTEPDTFSPEQIPWQLLQCIAIIQLYLEDKWIEPIYPTQYPLTLLYQQTLSTLAALGELTPAVLAQNILTLPPFSHITQTEFRQLLRHLIDLDHIQRTKEGGLIVGLTGEKIVRNFKFYAIFPDTEEYAVLVDGLEIGSIVLPPPTGSKFALAGLTWEVCEVDPRAKTVAVKPAQGESSVTWNGGGGETHTRILQRMRQVLFEAIEYRYLQAGARARLAAARQLAKKFALDKNPLIVTEENYCCLLPWVGTAAYRTLERFLTLNCREALKIKGVQGRSPYFFNINLGKSKPEALLTEIKSLGDRRLKPEELLKSDEVPQLQKYDEFIPPDLLRRAFVVDYLSLSELVAHVSQW